MHANMNITSKVPGNNTVLKEMKTYAKTKFRESVLVIAGFVATIAFGVTSEDRTRDSLDLSNFGGTLIFFVIAFFIAERPKGSFISRSQVVGAASFFLWLGLNQLFFFGENSLRSQYESTASNMAFGIVPIAAPFFFYWGSIFLIRGFHSAPTYQINEEVKQVGNGDAEEAV